MSLFRKRSVALLILLVLLSALAVWSPWKQVDQNAENAIGWPAEYTRGLRFGVDIIGGSRITLELRVSKVTFQITADNAENAWSELRGRIEDNLYVNVKPISFDSATGTAVAEIGRSLTENLLESIAGNLADIVSIESVASEETVNDVVSVLTARVDPYGTMGTSFTPLGANLVLFEVAGLPIEQAKALLGKPGKLEIFMDENLLIRGGDIVSVGTPGRSTREQNTAEVPFRLNDEGASKFSAAAAGKANYPTVIYVDRPTDSIVLFDESLLRLLHGLEYDSETMRFMGSTEDGMPYPVLVTAIPSPTDSLSENTGEYLASQAGLKTKVILLGDFSDQVKENLISSYSLVEIARNPGESVKGWIERACGLKSVVVISPDLASDLAQGMIVKDLTITIRRSTLDEAMQEARNLKIVLSERLPVEVEYVSETSIEPRLGSQFLKEALYAGIASLIGVFLLVYLWYRRLLISTAVIITMLSELAITLGVASVLNWSIGLPELGALVIVIGTGVDHQIIITNELLRGAETKAGAPGLGWRVSRAFSVIFAAAATTAAAMTMLALIGFGAMRGFGLITITGTLIAVLITRPAFANMASAIIVWQAKRGVKGTGQNTQRSRSARPQE